LNYYNIADLIFLQLIMYNKYSR